MANKRHCWLKRDESEVFMELAVKMKSFTNKANLQTQAEKFNR